MISGNMYYGYIPCGSKTSIVQIDNEDIECSTLTNVSAGDVGRIDLGNVPAGTYTVVLLPIGLTAYKDDGIGGKTEFALHNGVANTGANGAIVEINGIKYQVYGEFNLVAGQTVVYIEE